MLKSLGLDMPAKAKEQNGQDAVGEFHTKLSLAVKKICFQPRMGDSHKQPNMTDSNCSNPTTRIPNSSVTQNVSVTQTVSQKSRVAA